MDAKVNKPGLEEGGQEIVPWLCIYRDTKKEQRNI